MHAFVHFKIHHSAEVNNQIYILLIVLIKISNLCLVLQFNSLKPTYIYISQDHL